MAVFERVGRRERGLGEGRNSCAGERSDWIVSGSFRRIARMVAISQTVSIGYSNTPRPTASDGCPVSPASQARSRMSDTRRMRRLPPRRQRSSGGPRVARLLLFCREFHMDGYFRRLIGREVDILPVFRRESNFGWPLHRLMTVKLDFLFHLLLPSGRVSCRTGKIVVQAPAAFTLGLASSRINALRSRNSRSNLPNADSSPGRFRNISDRFSSR